MALLPISWSSFTSPPMSGAAGSGNSPKTRTADMAGSSRTQSAKASQPVSGTAISKHVEQQVGDLGQGELPGLHGGRVGRGRMAEAPGDAQERQHKDRDTDTDMDGRQEGSGCVVVFRALDQLFAEDDHEDHQQGSEPVQDDGTG